MSTWAAVIGSPIAHSLSPVLHRTAYSLVELDWGYRRFEVTAESLPGFLSDLDSECAGLSVTMPCKHALLEQADTVEGLAKAVGAANTLVIAGGLRAAFNTDVHGIVEALRDTYDQQLPDLRERHQQREASAVILGTGATASSALAALTTLGFTRVTVVGRNFQGPRGVLMAAGRLKVAFKPIYWKHEQAVLQACQEAEVIVSTVPDAVSGAVAHALAPRADQRVLDVTYARGDTALAQAFRRVGAPVASPLAMLVHQGLAQLKLMSGKEAPFDPVYRAVIKAAH